MLLRISLVLIWLCLGLLHYNCIVVVRITLNSALSPKRYNCLVCVGCGLVATSGTSFAFVGGKIRNISITVLLWCPALQISLIRVCPCPAVGFLVCLNNSLCVGLNALIGGSCMLHSVSAVSLIW